MHQPLLPAHHWAQARALFDRLIELPAGARAQLLSSSRAAPEVLAEVRSLLRHADTCGLDKADGPDGADGADVAHAASDSMPCAVMPGAADWSGRARQVAARHRLPLALGVGLALAATGLAAWLGGLSGLSGSL